MKNMDVRKLIIYILTILFYLSNTSIVMAKNNGMVKIVLNNDIPFSKQLTNKNTIYLIQSDFDLNDSQCQHPITIPPNCVLEFDGGSIRNGLIIGNGTTLSGYISILCNIDGSFTNDSFHSSWFGMNENDRDVSGRLSHIINFCTKTGVELIIDTDLNITHSIEIYPGDDNRNHVQGPMIRGKKMGTTINVNGEMVYAIKVVKNKSPLTSKTTFLSYSFYKYGYIKQLTFNVNKNTEAVLCVIGWWGADISQVVIKGNRKVAYGILFPYYNQVRNVDFYASAGLNIHDVMIYRTTKYGIANYNINGVPYLRLYNFTIEQNENGVLCNSAGWFVSEGSISYNNEYGLQVGNDIYTAKSNVFQHIEFDGNGKAAAYLYRSRNNTYSNNHFVARLLYGKNTQQYSYYINHKYVNAGNEFVNDCFTRNENLDKNVKVTAFVTTHLCPNIARNTILNPYFDDNIELSFNEFRDAFYSEKPERTMFRQINSLNNNIIKGSENTTKLFFGDTPPLDIAGSSMNGYYFYNKSLDIPIFYNGERWVKADGSTISVKNYGTFDEKPQSDNIYIGFRYFCTDRQSIEQKATNHNLKGIEIIYKGNNVWVDALGRIVE